VTCPPPSPLASSADDRHRGHRVIRNRCNNVRSYWSFGQLAGCAVPATHGEFDASPLTPETQTGDSYSTPLSCRGVKVPLLVVMPHNPRNIAKRTRHRSSSRGRVGRARRRMTHTAWAWLRILLRHGRSTGSRVIRAPCDACGRYQGQVMTAPHAEPRCASGVVAGRAQRRPTQRAREAESRWHSGITVPSREGEQRFGSLDGTADTRGSALSSGR
jgi:hypothetical protein